MQEKTCPRMAQMRRKQFILFKTHNSSSTNSAAMVAPLFPYFVQHE